MIRQSGETGDKPPVTPLSLSPTSRPHFAASFPENFMYEPPGHPRTFHRPTGDVSPHRVVIGPCARCAVSTAYHCSAQAFPGARPRLKIGCVAPNGCTFFAATVIVLTIVHFKEWHTLHKTAALQHTRKWVF